MVDDLMSRSCQWRQVLNRSVASPTPPRRDGNFRIAAKIVATWDRVRFVVSVNSTLQPLLLTNWLFIFLQLEATGHDAGTERRPRPCADTTAGFEAPV